jgi:hypothetical protein
MVEAEVAWMRLLAVRMSIATRTGRRGHVLAHPVDEKENRQAGKRHGIKVKLK